MSYISISKDDLRNRFREGLLAFQFSKATIERHLYGIRSLLSFMEKEQLIDYSHYVGEKYSNFILLDTRISDYCKQRNLRSIHLLNVILEGKPYSKRCVNPVSYSYPGEIGELAKQFLEYLRTNERLAETTMDVYKKELSYFSQKMTIREVTVSSLNKCDILSFVSSVQNTRPYVLARVKRFLSYLYDNECITQSFSQLFKGIKSHRKEKLPSYYDINEVSKIENSIERTSALGKRDYAMILLASRLGFRSSDICLIKFSNINWDKNLIHLQQYKTKRDITLPLLSDVGDALIDYITNGRPSSPLKNIFLTARHPYRALHGSSFSSIVSQYIYRSGIDFKGKHVGPHSLRHSLATLLLREGTGLPIISEVLGHSSTGPTMTYLQVDTVSLLECSLDIPMVDEAFYLQKGGMLYE